MVGVYVSKPTGYREMVGEVGEYNGSWTCYTRGGSGHKPRMWSGGCSREQAIAAFARGTSYRAEELEVG